MVSNDWVHRGPDPNPKHIDNWAERVAVEIVNYWPVDINDDLRAIITRSIINIIVKQCPFKQGVAYEEVKPK